MITYFVLAFVVVAVFLFLVWLFRDEFDAGAFNFFGTIVVIIILAILWPIVDSFYARSAFEETAACSAKRMTSARKSMTTNVICVPAYRDTKNDTLTVNVP